MGSSTPPPSSSSLLSQYQLERASLKIGRQPGKCHPLEQYSLVNVLYGSSKVWVVMSWLQEEEEEEEEEEEQEEQEEDGERIRQICAVGMNVVNGLLVNVFW